MDAFGNVSLVATAADADDAGLEPGRRLSVAGRAVRTRPSTRSRSPTPSPARSCSWSTRLARSRWRSTAATPRAALELERRRSGGAGAGVTAFGQPHLHLRITGSTNDRARELAQAGAPNGTVVTAGEQSAGRGRRGRTWAAPAGQALLYSAILRPLDLTHVLLAARGAGGRLRGGRGRGAGSRGADQVAERRLARRAKVAGVLIEARPPEWAVIGIGVNVAIDAADFPADLRWPATSIGGAATVAATRDAVSRALGRWVDAPADEVLAEFRRRDALVGREIAWEGGGIDARRRHGGRHRRARQPRGRAGGRRARRAGRRRGHPARLRVGFPA